MSLSYRGHLSSQYRGDEILGNTNCNLNMGIITSRFLKQKQAKMTSTKKPHLLKKKKYSKVKILKFVNEKHSLVDFYPFQGYSKRKNYMNYEYDPMSDYLQQNQEYFFRKALTPCIYKLLKFIQLNLFKSELTCIASGPFQ